MNGNADAVAKPVRPPAKSKDGDADAVAKPVRSPAKRIKEETGKQSTNQPCTELRKSSGCPDNVISLHHWPHTCLWISVFLPKVDSASF